MKITTIKDTNIYTWEDLEIHLGKEKYKQFIEWMAGQTCIAEGAYTWDYERWIGK